MAALMNNAELDRLEALANAATPGPWSGEAGSVVNWHDRTFDMEWIDNRRKSTAQRDADCEFIAAAREAIPALIATLRKARKAEQDLCACLLAYIDAPTNPATHAELLLRLARATDTPLAELQAKWASNIAGSR